MCLILCAAVLAWSVLPTAYHAAGAAETLSVQAETIAAHGHAHGAEDGQLWIRHGHSPDSMDHDHSQAVVPGPDMGSLPMKMFRTAWRLSAATANPLRVYLIERPPRV